MDDKVRTSHQQNNGKIFTRDNPPHTGHPGEDYNCRCIAEPYIEGVTEYANQTLISDVMESLTKWDNFDFLGYGYYGNGREVSLAKAGHLKGVINYFFYHLGAINKINQQIIAKARSLQKSGYFNYDFRNAYPFEGYLYCFGGSIVSGFFSGFIKNHNKMLYIKGSIKYRYEDLFTDQYELRDKILTYFLGTHGSSDPKLVSETVRVITDLGATPYVIYDNWETSFNAEIKCDKASSLYQ